MCDIESLKIDACANGFYQAAQVEPIYRAALLQLLCIGIAPPTPSGGISGEGVFPVTGEGGIVIDFLQ